MDQDFPSPGFVKVCWGVTLEVEVKSLNLEEQCT